MFASSLIDYTKNAIVMWSTFCLSSQESWNGNANSNQRQPVILFGGVILLLVCQGCSQPAEQAAPKTSSTTVVQEVQPWPPDDRRSAEHIGSEACQECHQEIYDAYQSHPMSVSLKLASQIQRPDFEPVARFETGLCTNEVQVKNGEILHSEEFVDDSGEQIYRQSVPVDFAIGSGQRGYTFVTNREGRLFQSPITWYTGTGQFGLSPGYDSDSHPRFERRVSDGCITCHSGLTRTAEAAYHTFQPDVFAEMSIGCERCHGPGAAHVEFHQHSNPSGQDQIVNPADLDPARRESVCYQCHLLGTKRILRANRTEFDFRPGDLVSDIWVVFQRGTGVVNSTQTTAVSQVEQFVVSKCFQQSNGTFGCASCHDPHGMAPQQERISHYNTRCSNCHLESESGCREPFAKRIKTSPENSCVQCHMPTLNANNVPHTSQTDHRILSRPLQKVAQTPGEIGVFEPETFSIPDEEVQRAYGLALADVANESTSQNLVEAATNALSVILERGIHDVPILDAASTLLIYQNPTQAERIALDGYQQAPQNESILETLAIVNELQGDLNDSLRWTTAFLELNETNSTMWERKSRLLLKLKKFKEARESAKSSLAVNPRNTGARKILIQAAEGLNQIDEAEQQTYVLEKLQKFKERHSEPERAP